MKSTIEKALQKHKAVSAKDETSKAHSVETEIQAEQTKTTSAKEDVKATTTKPTKKQSKQQHFGGQFREMTTSDHPSTYLLLLVLTAILDDGS